MALLGALLIVGTAAPASAAAAAGADSCGYPNASNATVFNENTLTKAAAVYGSGASAKIAVFSDDEWATLLGIGATPMPATTAANPAAHVSNPSTGDPAALDAAGRPQYPALFITDQGTVMPPAPITSGDWQHGGAPAGQVQDVFGTWVTASYDAQGNYVRGPIPPFKNNSNGAWILGPGSDPLPTTNSPTSFVSAGKNSTEGYGSEFRWDAASLGLVAGHTYRVQVMTHDGDQNKAGGDVGEACMLLTIPGNPPGQLAIVKTDDTNHSVNPGGAFNFKLAVSNTGAGPANNAVVTDTLPAGIVSNGAPTTTGGGACALAGSKITCTYPSIAAGGSATVTIPVKADGTVCGKITNTGTVAADNIAAANSSDDVTVNCVTGLAIVKTDDTNHSVSPGGAFNFKLAVSNTGNTAANNVVVTDTLPAGIVSNGAPTTTGAGACALAGLKITCTYASLAVGGSVNITIPSKADGTVCGPITNTGSAAADGIAAVNSSDVVTVNCAPSLHIVKSADKTSVNVGDPFNFFLDVTNTGTTAAINAVVTDSVPAGLGVGTPTTTGGGACAKAGQVVTCTYPSLAVGATPKVTIPVSTTNTMCGPYDNKGSVKADNNTSVDSNTVRVVVNCPNITLTVVKTNDANGDGSFNDSETAAAPGQTVPFKVTVTNTGAAAIVVDSIGDAWPGNNISPTCAAAFIGANLAANGGSATCTFSVASYSPAKGGSVTNTATVVGHLVNDPTKIGSAQDTSVVNTAGAVPITLTVVKVNDANGDKTYNDSESAADAGQAVPFRVTVINTTSVAVDIDSITDAFGSTTIDPACAATFIGVTLAANGGSATCDFTVDSYSPANGTSLTNTAEVKGHEHGDTSNKGSAKDTSVVTTGPLAPIVLNVVKTNDANGDGTYNDSETSLLPGQTVPFRIAVTNNSTVAVVIDTVSDTWNDAVGTLSINPQCLVAFLGQVLQPGDSATCDFTVANYSPPNGTNVINTGEVKGHQEKKPDNKGSGTDTSIVDTATPPLTLTVVKTNDANGNGSFTDDETGTTGGSVNFRVAITNSSTVDVVIDSISDVWPGADAISPNCAASIIGAVLPANGGTVTCDFALANYVPNSTDARVNTVTVLAHQNNNPGNSTSQQDTSTVRGEQVADVVITRQPTPLARTGSNTLGLVALGLLLIGLGLGLLLTSGWRPVAGALAVRLPHSASSEVFTPSRVIIDRDVDFFSSRYRGRR